VSATFVSWTHSTSVPVSSSHSVTRGSRLVIELMFHVAMRTLAAYVAIHRPGMAAVAHTGFRFVAFSRVPSSG
jgi:hypothetical protein